jgi:hypothetical protein
MTFSIIGNSQEAEIYGQILNGSALIEINNSSGSGFFIKDTSEIFFLTARHVIMDPQIDPKTHKIIGYYFKSPSMAVKWYPRNPDKSTSNLMIVDLENLHKDGNLKFGSTEEDDFAIMRIAVLEQKEAYLSVNYSKNITRSGQSSSINGYPMYILNSFEEINVGDEMIMVGYPKSLGLKQIPQYDFNRPLLRKGIIAGKDSNRKNIIIDCPSYGGNSGGAIFEIIKDGLASEFKLIGIVSAFIPLEEVWINPSYGIRNIELSNSGYSVVVPVQKAIDKIESIRRNKFL